MKYVTCKKCGFCSKVLDHGWATRFKNKEKIGCPRCGGNVKLIPAITTTYTTGLKAGKCYLTATKKPILTRSAT